MTNEICSNNEDCKNRSCGIKNDKNSNMVCCPSDSKTEYIDGKVICKGDTDDGELCFTDKQCKGGYCNVGTDNKARCGTVSLDICAGQLNLYKGIDGNEYICPSNYSFGNQNRYNYTDLWEKSKNNSQQCWMSDTSKSDCGWGSCDPSLYNTPTNKKITLEKDIYWGQSTNNDPIGSFVKTKYDGTKYPVYYITKPMKYSETEHCDRSKGVCTIS